MNIVDLAILKKMVAGGGGSGTDNYNDLSNLPQINGETLAGNKTAENLGLQDALTFDSAPTEDSTNPVESGGVYNALAGKQDNLTFDDDPTENSTNPVKSGGVYSALADKQDNLTFDGVYNASTNKAATESTVTNAIAGLDVSAFSVDADETISSISETDGKINVTKQDIDIASNQVTAMTGYTKPSSAPATPAIQTSDTANQAFGKLEFKADTNQTNILSVQDMVCDDTFSTSKSYAVGDITIYDNNKLYKFKNAHQGAWSASDVDQISLSQLEAEDRSALVEVVDSGAKNKLKLDKDAIKSLNSGGTWSGYVYTPTTAPNLTVTINDDGTLTLNGSTSSSLVTVALEKKASSGFQGYVLSGSKTNTKFVYQLAVSPYTAYATVDGTDSAVIANYTDGSTIQLSLQVVANSTFSNTVITPMICSQADWKVSQNHTPYTLPNTDLTVLEAEDRAALAEVVDSGAKNRLDDIGWMNDIEIRNGTKSVSNGAITLTATNTDCYTGFIPTVYPENYNIYVTAGEQIVLTWKYIAGNSQTDDRVYIFKNGESTNNVYANATDEKLIYTAPSNCTFITFRVGVATSGNSATYSNIMICSLSDWKVSKKYVPFKYPDAFSTVHRSTSNASRTISYTMKHSDFITKLSPGASCGTYLISVVSWSTTPTFSLYTVSYSGGLTTYTNTTKIAGGDLTITITGDTMSFDTSGKVVIYALK